MKNLLINLSVVGIHQWLQDLDITDYMDRSTRIYPKQLWNRSRNDNMARQKK
jgi:hypothetical protein